MDNNDTHLDFRMKTAEFRGYTVKAMEDLDRNDKRIEAKVDKLVNKIDCLQDEIVIMNSRVDSLYVKVAGVGAAAGVLVSVLVSVVL